MNIFHKALNYFLGYDYIIWKNSVYKGVSRVRTLPSGDHYFLAYGSVDCFNFLDGRPGGNGEVVVAFLTCKKSKYINS